MVSLGGYGIGEVVFMVVMMYVYVFLCIIGTVMRNLMRGSLSLYRSYVGVSILAIVAIVAYFVGIRIGGVMFISGFAAGWVCLLMYDIVLIIMERKDVRRQAEMTWKLKEEERGV